MFFKGVDDPFPRKMFRAIEGHVFQEMGQSVLVVFLQNCPHILNDIKTCPLFGFLVVADVVGQSVLQFSDTDFGIDRHRRYGLLAGSRENGPRRQYRQEQMLHFVHVNCVKFFCHVSGVNSAMLQ